MGNNSTFSFKHNAVCLSVCLCVFTCTDKFIVPLTTHTPKLITMVKIIIYRLITKATYNVKSKETNKQPKQINTQYKNKQTKPPAAKSRL